MSPARDLSILAFLHGYTICRAMCSTTSGCLMASPIPPAKEVHIKCVYVQKKTVRIPARIREDDQRAAVNGGGKRGDQSSKSPPSVPPRPIYICSETTTLPSPLSSDSYPPSLPIPPPLPPGPLNRPRQTQRIPQTIPRSRRPQEDRPRFPRGESQHLS